MKKMNARVDQDENENRTDKPADDELDEPSFVFLGLDFQLAELRYGVLEVNLTPAGVLVSRVNRRIAELRPGHSMERSPIGQIKSEGKPDFLSHFGRARPLIRPCHCHRNTRNRGRAAYGFDAATSSGCGSAW